MKDENKSKVMALIIGVLMIGSVAGFAGLSLVGRSSYSQQTITANTDTGPSVPNIVYRELDSTEILYVLQTGRVLMQYIYEEGCVECLDDKQILENVANQLPNFIVLQAITGEETSFTLIGINGAIVDYQDDITEDGVIDTFCNIAPVRPQECLLRSFANPDTSELTPTGDGGT